MPIINIIVSCNEFSVYSDTIFPAALSADASSFGYVIFDRDEINPGGH